MFSVFTCERQLWDIRKKGAIHTFQNTYQVLAVTFNDTSDQIMSGGIDNDIKVLAMSKCLDRIRHIWLFLTIIKIGSMHLQKVSTWMR